MRKANEVEDVIVSKHATEMLELFCLMRTATPLIMPPGNQWGVNYDAARTVEQKFASDSSN